MDEDEIREAAKAGTKDALAEHAAEAEVFGPSRLARYHRERAEDPAKLRRERRNMPTEGDDDDAAA